MRIALILCMLCLTTWACAQEWVIQAKKDNTFIIQNINNASLSYPVFNSGGTPKFLRKETLGAPFTHIQKLIYFSGSAGTQTIYDIYRAVLFDSKSKKFKGDFPYQEKALGKVQPLEKSSWKITGNTLIIEDEEKDYKETIDLK